MDEKAAISLANFWIVDRARSENVNFDNLAEAQFGWSYFRWQGEYSQG